MLGLEFDDDDADEDIDLFNALNFIIERCPYGGCEISKNAQREGYLY